MRAAANGVLKKLIFIVIAFVVVIFGMTYYVPFSQSYEIKTAVRVACNGFINIERHRRISPPPDVDFENKAHAAGVQLTSDDYSFEIDYDKATKEWVCDADIEYPTKTEWAVIGHMFELPPFEMNMHIEMQHRVGGSY